MIEYIRIRSLFDGGTRPEECRFAVSAIDSTGRATVCSRIMKQT
jgi:hypothetical protein